MTAAISSETLIQTLIDRGIVPQREVRRVIIDAEVGDVVRIHVECFGAPDLLQVIAPGYMPKETEISILEGITAAEVVPEIKEITDKMREANALNAVEPR